jgi:hypothetical protein
MRFGAFFLRHFDVDIGDGLSTADGIIERHYGVTRDKSSWRLLLNWRHADCSQWPSWVRQDDHRRGRDERIHFADQHVDVRQNAPGGSRLGLRERGALRSTGATS